MLSQQIKSIHRNTILAHLELLDSNIEIDENFVMTQSMFEKSIKDFTPRTSKKLIKQIDSFIKKLYKK